MSDRTCIICREEMILRAPATGPDQGEAQDPQPRAPVTDGPNTTPKKLPCGHIFHFYCLRSWLERQQSCPTWYATPSSCEHFHQLTMYPVAGQFWTPRHRAKMGPLECPEVYQVFKHPTHLEEPVFQPLSQALNRSTMVRFVMILSFSKRSIHLNFRQCASWPARWTACSSTSWLGSTRGPQQCYDPIPYSSPSPKTTNGAGRPTSPAPTCAATSAITATSAV